MYIPLLYSVRGRRGGRKEIGKMCEEGCEMRDLRRIFGNGTCGEDIRRKEGMMRLREEC